MLFRLRHCRDNIQQEREMLIIDLNQKASLLNLNISIVFDSTYHKSESRRTHFENLEILYTDLGETADDYILNELKNARTPRQEIVVTSDKKLAFLVKHFLAKTETVEKFIIRINRSYQKKLYRPEYQLSHKKIEIKPSINKPTLPSPSVPQSIESSSEIDYLTIFEERWQEIQKNEPVPSKKESIPANKTKKELFPNKPNQSIENPGIRETDMERWLRLFEDR